MKRPNIYSKPLEGNRTDNYHPADLDGQYAQDLNKYIDYLETEVKKLSKANVSGQLPELFRNFIRTNHLTSKWELYLKENEGNLR